MHAVLPLGALAAAACLAASPGRATALDSMVVLSVVGALLVEAGTRLHQPDLRRLWRQVVLALVLLTVANATATVPAGSPLSGLAGRLDLLCNALGWLLFFAAAVQVVLRHATHDPGGVTDAAITGAVASGVLWTVLLSPRLRAAGVPTGAQAYDLVIVTLVCMTLGALVQLARTCPAARPSLAYLTTATAVSLGGEVAWPLTAPATSDTPPGWVFLLFEAGYLAVGAAALHPSTVHLGTPGRAVEQRLTTPRLVALGAALGAAPLFAGVRQLLALPADGVQLLVGTTAVVPLVLARVAQIARERAQAEAQLAHRASHDGLTGLLGRGTAIARLEALLPAAAASGVPVAVLFLDLDGFKQVNDLHGHLRGDELLVAVATRLRGWARTDDVLARLGGDEFLVVAPLPHGAGTGEALELAAGLRALVSRPGLLPDLPGVGVGASVGCAVAQPGGGLDADALIAAADTGMYADKATRRRRRGEVPAQQRAAG
ncbi:diguanylate cyclase (GGDEF)-like protein [Motilibacter rhizosphaerae]|uniref:Diguanylate cyclase (GGDEF)-like protein n=1 Tax=Motilibacter rhizosphaerae TaxID=598652 RepID=A0A4Q7NVM8_9ACTN|nr:GGDEF domain-containing protein [Motilibacter rhizosphaerae]RZS91247.1 diguanylate cyclase (GGDEF)-like protein [Motilibacter rhizosphaerae]